MNVPTLQCDEQAKSRGWKPDARHIIERQIVWNLLHRLIAMFPDDPLRVFDGEETTDCNRDPVAAMELIFDLDEATVKVGKGSWVLLIMGNGECVISDYGVNPNVEAAIDAVEKELGLS